MAGLEYEHLANNPLQRLRDLEVRVETLEREALTDVVAVGDTLIWFLDITNPGPDDSTPVIFTATMPDVMEIITVGTTQGSASVDGQFITVDIGVIPAGATVREGVDVRRIPRARVPGLRRGVRGLRLRRRLPHHLTIHIWVSSAI